MIFKEYLDSINELAKQHPELLDAEAIYSHDDEGNHYQPVGNCPVIAEVENPTEYYVEMIAIGDKNVTKANCVIIN